MQHNQPNTNSPAELSSPAEPLSPILPVSTNAPPFYSSPPSTPPPSEKLRLGPTTTPNKNTLPTNHNPITHWKSDTKNFRIQGWDPILIISQILAIQAIHYLVLSLIIPPMLSLFANPVPIEYEGGSKNVAMIIDWRAMVGRSTLHMHNEGLDYQLAHPIGGLAGFGKLPKSLGRKPFKVGNRSPTANIDAGRSINSSSSNNLYPPHDAHSAGLFDKLQLGPDQERIHNNLNLTSLNSSLFYDPTRSWVISVAWLITSLVGVMVLYQIVGRPKQIMDHSLTISLNHLILTSYYSSRLPTSLWFYSVLIFSSIVQIVLAEQLCVRREFRDGLGVGWKVDHRPDDD